MRLVVVLLVILPLTAASGKCKVSKVQSICEANCEKDSRPVDRVAVPPPGTLLPPTGIYTGVDEGAAPPAAFNGIASPADGGLKHATALLEMESMTGNYYMDCDGVESFVSPVALLPWTNVHTASFGCADGRTTDSMLGTWGGDFGEFVTAINVYEQMTSTRLSLADVTNILRRYLSATSRTQFTTCMSSTVLKQLVGGELGSGPWTVEDMEAAIKTPSEEHVAAMWLKITDPNYVGNDHIKLMLQSPDDYSVRKDLVQHVIHAFFDILWNPFDPLRDQLHIQVLMGENHNESAVIGVTVPDFCLKQAGLVPLIPHSSPTASAVILNPDAIQVFRKELSLYFGRMTVPVVREDEMLKRLSVLTAGQAALTSRVLFSRVPVYSARISQ